MPETYKAKLRGNRIRWIGEPPVSVDHEVDVDVNVTIIENQVGQTELRPFGLAKGEFVVSGDFDESLPEEILVEFEH
ncbi:MAG: hypothetical protein ABIV48_00725 [Pyrinomonadaceae bacterium]